MGYLGQAYSAWMASINHEVTTIGKLTDTEKLEPDLVDMIERQRQNKKLYNAGENLFLLEGAEVVWVTFDTPIQADGKADVEFVFNRVIELCDYVHRDVPILISSQIPVGTMARIEASQPGRIFGYIPENVRVGRSVSYLKYIDRLILGTRHPRLESLVQSMINSISIYRPTPVPVIVMSPESAEFVKHTINAFLATCISFSNEMGMIAKAMSANPDDVYRGIRSEYRIGPNLPLKSGGPFKTGHLERDLMFLENIAQLNGISIPLLIGTTQTNNALKV